MGRGKGEYDVVLRCRAPQGIKDRLERLLERRGHGDLSELIREALLRYVEAEEARLGIGETLPFYPPASPMPLSLVAEEPPPYKTSQEPGEAPAERKKRPPGGR